MVKQEGAKKDQPSNLKRLYDFLFQRRSWWLVGIGAWIGFITWLIVHWSHAFSNPNERYNFIAQQMFNGLVFTAVVVQALIYFGQLRVMGIAINPRLRITNVETTSFDPDKMPVLIVTLTNEGATDAIDVAMHLKAQLDAGTGTEWHKQQIVTIPAHGKREYFLRWAGPLNQALIDEINDGKKTWTLVGYYASGKTKPQQFCYKFHGWPWKEPRPERLPHFIPCDITTTQNVFVMLEPMRLKATGHAVSAVVTKNPPKQTAGQITPTGSVTNVVIPGNKPNESPVAEKKEESEEKTDKAK